LPETLNRMKRVSFKVGEARYANIASIESKYGMPDKPEFVTREGGR